jgi:hypothetical protein
MDTRFIESLEGRRFLSADVTGGGPDGDGPLDSVLQMERTPRGATLTLLGTWRGTVIFGPGDTDTLKLKFTRISAGRFIGKMVSLEDPSLFLKIKARFTEGRNFRFTFEGGSDEGAISGRGTARLKPEGDRFVGDLSGSTAGEPFTGTFTFRRKD